MHHPRRSHHKSRNGCQTCKTRRVKCDEGGPPCMNCSRRGTECSYGPPGKPKRNRSPLVTRPNEPIPAPELDFISMNLTLPTRETIELQLLHRWSTSTYLSCACELTDDYHVWQRTVPEIAMKYDFLMDMLLALTAFDMAQENSLGEAQQWLSTALGYQGRAIGRFHEYLKFPSTPDDDSFDAKLYCSLLLMVVALASATHQGLKPGDDKANGKISLLEHTLIHHELVRGVQSITGREAEQRVKTHPLQVNVPQIASLSRSPLEPEIEAIIDRLNCANESRVQKQPMCEATVKGEDEASLSAWYSGCKTAIACLKFLYLTCQDKQRRGIGFSWLTMGGDDYVTALKSRDPVSLMVLMSWAAFIDPVGEECWFAKDFGKRLVFEIAEVLQTDPSSPWCEDVIVWARNEVVRGAEKYHSRVVDPVMLELCEDGVPQNDPLLSPRLYIRKQALIRG